jgi:ADP-ribose pyrophosphatase YjhB (NUDIX family)
MIETSAMADGGGAVHLKFCPKCGGHLLLQPVAEDPKERLVCQSCRFIYYQDPKVSACAIPVLDGKVVMVRRAINPGRGLWVFPGGYMDQDETAEEAAARETREEVNLEVRVTGLVGVYSYRTPVVVIVFACEVLGGELRIDRESLEVRTFAEAEIPWEELAFPSTRDALSDFFRGRGGRTGMS